MESTVSELRDKEVIDISGGSRFGYVGDVAVDLETGRVKALVVPGRLRLFGLLGREKDHVFPWSSVRRFGEDELDDAQDEIDDLEEPDKD